MATQVVPLVHTLLGLISIAIRQYSSLKVVCSQAQIRVRLPLVHRMAKQKRLVVLQICGAIRLRLQILRAVPLAWPLSLDYQLLVLLDHIECRPLILGLIYLIMQLLLVSSLGLHGQHFRAVVALLVQALMLLRCVLTIVITHGLLHQVRAKTLLTLKVLCVMSRKKTLPIRCTTVAVT